MNKNANTDIELSFEDALARLEGIVKQLEQGDVVLEELLARFAEGIGLSQLCLSKLNCAETAVHKLLQQDAGKLVERTLNVQEEEQC